MDENIIINLNQIVCLKDTNDLPITKTEPSPTDGQKEANIVVVDNKQEEEDSSINTQKSNSDAVLTEKPSSEGEDKDNDEPVSVLKNPNAFYNNAQNYWSSIQPTVDGMLGGFSNINSIDIRGSINFLQDLFKLKPAPGRRFALDCGAGIGRVTKQLLLPYFQTIDLVEQNKEFTNSIETYVNAPEKIGNIYNEGLQDFTPIAGKYDLIWSQWVLGHLTDNDLKEFFQRCLNGLAKNGIMVIKENVTFSENVVVDNVDSSVTRPMIMLKHLMIKSGMRILKFTRQNNFPTEIFPVYIFAVKANNRTR